MTLPRFHGAGAEAAIIEQGRVLTTGEEAAAAPCRRLVHRCDGANAADGAVTARTASPRHASASVSANPIRIFAPPGPATCVSQLLVALALQVRMEQVWYSRL